MKLLISKSEKRGGKSVFIAIPTYGDITSQCTYALWGAKEELIRAGIGADLAIFYGNCHVDDGRNRLVKEFLDTDCDEFVFIDADVNFQGLDLVKLINHDKDVVAGIYPLKQETEEYPVRFIGDEIRAENGLVEVESVPTGFLKIKRHVLEKLYEKAPKFLGKNHIGEHGIPIIFERTFEGNKRWGGDYTFCLKWRALGGKIHIDPEMYFGHVGQSEWEGHLGHYLREINGLQTNYISYMLDKIKEGTETFDDLKNLVCSWGNHFSVDANFLQTLILVARENEKDVIEFGSGLTTLVLGALGDKHGFKVISLEHNDEWFKKVTQNIKECGISSAVVNHCNLVNGFYDFDIRGQWGIALIDGPPRSIGDRTSGYNVKADVIIVDDECPKIDGYTLKKLGLQKVFSIGVKNETTR